MMTNNPILTLAEIEAQFDAEWVLIEEPDTTDTLEIQRGKVCYHSKDRDEVYRAAIQLHSKRFAVLYTGKLPQGTAIIL